MTRDEEKTLKLVTNLDRKAIEARLSQVRADAQVQRDPMVVAEGRMGLSEFSRRGRLAWQALGGAWA